MRQHTVKTLRWVFFLSILLSSPLVNADVYFLNDGSGSVLDVKGASSVAGTTVGQHTLNYTNAQRFDAICQQPNCAYVLIRTRTSPANQPLYLSLKPDRVLTDITSAETARQPVPPTSSAPGVTAYLPPINLGSSFLITQEALYRDTPASAASAFGNKSSYQHWKLIPVPDNPGLFHLQSMAFDHPHYLQPNSNRSNSPLTIRPAVQGDRSQMWFMGETKPSLPKNVRLGDFRWFFYEITGNLKWDLTVQDAERYMVWVRREESPGRFSEHWKLKELVGNPTQATFKDGSRHGRNKKHCFSIEVFNRWGANHTPEVCAVPLETPDVTPTPVGVSKISFTNCHREYKNVRLWLNDLSSPMVWQDLGNWNHQWDSRRERCPTSSAKIIPLQDRHTYTFVAIDCGSDSPDNTQGSCHKLTSYGLKGLNGNGVVFLQVD